MGNEPKVVYWWGEGWPVVKAQKGGFRKSSSILIMKKVYEN